MRPDTLPALPLPDRVDPLTTIFELRGIEVRARGAGIAIGLQPTSVVTDRHILERGGASIASAIAWEPGVSVRTNGPMAAQPVIRGLSGDRVLVLEDGVRTGDIATTAPDHAVTVDPATARRIEVIRGPAGLLYGSNTLGGVVNVVRDDIPFDVGGGVRLSGGGGFESGTMGWVGQGRMEGGHGPIRWLFDASGRTAGDTKTPEGGVLPFTDFEGSDIGAGVALVGHATEVGVAIRDVRSRYGVPSSFDGIVLPGAHEGGIYVELARQAARVEGEWRGTGLVENLRVAGNGVRFEQSEYELGGIVGTRFGQLSSTGEVVARLRGGARHRPALGIAGDWRDMRAEGSYTGTRPAVRSGLAAFLVDEVRIGPLTILAGLRYDRVRIRPLDRTESVLLRDLRARSFDAVTGALGFGVEVGEQWTLSVQGARAFRPPSIEELFSAGPHLASYAYEVGNPALAPERGTGVDLLVRRFGERTRVEASAYGMQISDFITFRPQMDPLTGAPMRDPRLRRYVIYRPESALAQVRGFELRAHILPASGWGVDLSVHGASGRDSEGEPLSGFPPGAIRLRVERAWQAMTLAMTGEALGAQREVPTPPSSSGLSCNIGAGGPDEALLPAEYCPTPGVLLLGALATFRLPRSPAVGQGVLVVGVDNLFDRRWHDPLWRAKQVAPQPGRNVRIGVRFAP